MMKGEDPVLTWLTADYMESILQRAVQLPDLEVLCMDIKSGPGNHYARKIFRIGLLLNISGVESRITVIGKLQPKSKYLEKITDKFDLFALESEFYSTTLPKLRILAPHPFTAVSYHVDMEKKIIILEDLMSKNYQMHPKRQFLDINQCVMVVEALAWLHGTSHLAILNDPSLRAKHDNTFLHNEKCEAFIKFVENGRLGISTYLKGYDLPPETCEKLQFLVQRLDRSWLEVLDLKEECLNFLLHGDCWVDNLMFHYTDDVLDGVKLLCFQSINFNSFANDLQYFLFSSAEADVILQYLDVLLECYVNKLCSICPNVPGISLARVKAEFNQRNSLGLLIVIICRAMVVYRNSDKKLSDRILEGYPEIEAYNEPQYIADLKRILPCFERQGIL